MPTESRRVLPDIHRDIEHRALHHAHQFSLRLPDLIMQSAQHVLRGARVVVLHEIDIASGQLGKLLPIEAFEKEAAVVAEYLGFDDQQVGYRGMDQSHDGMPFSLSTRIR